MSDRDDQHNQKGKKRGIADYVITIVVGGALVAGLVFTIFSFIESGNKKEEMKKEVAEQREAQSNEEDEKAKEVEEPDEDANADIGQDYIDFTTTTIEGDNFTLSDYEGEKVLLNFWASWCAPCRNEMPSLQDASDKYDDVEVIAVNLTEQDSEDNIKDFLDEFDIHFTIPLDEDSSIASMYQIIPIPSTFMINSDGEISDIAMGEMDDKRIGEMIENAD